MGTLFPSSQNNVRVGPISRKIIWPVKTGGVELFQRTTNFSFIVFQWPQFASTTQLNHTAVYLSLLWQHESLFLQPSVERMCNAQKRTDAQSINCCVCNCSYRWHGRALQLCYFVIVEIESCTPPPSPLTKCLQNAFFQSYKGNIS